MLLWWCISCASTADNSRSAPRKDELRIGFAGANLQSNEFGVGQFATLLSLEGLTYSAPDGRTVPRLAQSWTWEDGGLSLRVTLRPGIRFHDGTPLTSTVVAESLRQAAARPANRALYPSLAEITAITTEGDSQILITLRGPDAFLPDELSGAIEHGSTHAGTGPYQVVERQKSALVLRRFDSYYLGRPAISRIVVRPFDTLRTAWSSLLRREVDMLSDVQPDAVEFVRSDNVQVISFARGYQYLIAFNSQRPPFTSPAVRRALNMAVDRDALIDAALKGSAEPATGPLWPKHWAYDTSIASYEYDPRGAEALLETAGFVARKSAGLDAPPARLRFTCLVPSGFSTLERIGLIVQRQLYQIGVDVRFEVVSAANYDARIREGDFDAVLLDLISGPTFDKPYVFWRSGKKSKGLNVFGYEDGQAQRLFEVLRTATNEAAIRSATRRLQTVLQEDPPALFLAWSKRTRAISRDFRVFNDNQQDPVLTLWQWKADKAVQVSLPR